MKKGLVIAGSIISALCIIILALMVFSIMGFEPESDNILHDTSKSGNSFSFDQDETYFLHVYAIGSVDCSQFEISIIYENYESLNRNCDDGDLYTTDEYTFLGDLGADESGTYEISADGDVIIVDANDVATDGFISVASCGCCFIGLILLIVGLVTGKQKPQVMMIQADGSLVDAQGQFVQQQPLSGQIISQPPQYIPQAQETSVEEYSFEQKNDWK